MRDLTGTRPDSLSSAEFQQVLSGDFLYTIKRDEREGRPPYYLTVAPNPFRPSAGTADVGYRFRGELEVSNYGPRPMLADALAAYSTFGRVGGALATAREDGSGNAYWATLLYRFSAERPTGQLPIIVRTSVEGDVRTVSRRELMAAATREAVTQFLFEVIRRAKKEGHPVVLPRMYAARSIADATERVESFGRSSDP
jgi:hypothetical protein